MYGPIIKGKKVLLQPGKISQAKQFLQWVKDPEVIRFVSTDYDNLDLEGEKKFLRGIKQSKDTIFWSISTMRGKFIGSTSLMHISAVHKKCVWGIMIGDKSQWNKGYGLDTLHVCLKYAFEKLKMHRFELAVFTGNKRAIRCYEKAGLKRESRKRQTFFRDGRYYDEIIMSMLSEEYFKIK